MATAEIRTTVTEEEQREIDRTVRIGKRAQELLKLAHETGDGCELSADQIAACVQLGIIKV